MYLHGLRLRGPEATINALLPCPRAKMAAKSQRRPQDAAVSSTSVKPVAVLEPACLTQCLALRASPSPSQSSAPLPNPSLRTSFPLPSPIRALAYSLTQLLTHLLPRTPPPFLPHPRPDLKEDPRPISEATIGLVPEVSTDSSV